MAKATIKKTAVETEELSAIVGILRDAILTVDAKADAAIGLKVGQCVLTFGGNVYDVVVTKRGNV